MQQLVRPRATGRDMRSDALGSYIIAQFVAIDMEQTATPQPRLLYCVARSGQYTWVVPEHCSEPDYTRHHETSKLASWKFLQNVDGSTIADWSAACSLHNTITEYRPSQRPRSKEEEQRHMFNEPEGYQRPPTNGFAVCACQGPRACMNAAHFARCQAYNYSALIRSLPSAVRYMRPLL